MKIRKSLTIIRSHVCRTIVIVSFSLWLNPVLAEVIIEGTAWTNQVDSNSNQPGKRYQKTAQRGELYFWMKVKDNP